MQTKEAQELLERYQQGKASDQEIEKLLDWVRLLNDEQKPAFSIEELKVVRDEIWQNIQPGIKIVKLRPWYRLVAAAIILCIGLASYFFIKNHASEPSNKQFVDFKPGGDKAILTLANGEQIALINKKNGLLTKEASIIIQKTASGIVEYHFQPGQENSYKSPTQYTMVSTPRAGRWLIILPDSSKVWLNALSSIRIPSSFTNKTRSVEITGEAYFEVKHHHTYPFRVLVKGKTIEDLGTRFNINAYNDEPFIKATLIDGAIRVENKRGKVLLRPGQQAILENASVDKPISVASADIDEVMAWKNDYFIFNNEDIRSIMRKVSRWYDVDVIYRGDVGREPFVGSVSRFRNVSEVLRKLEATGTVHFKLEEGRIIVMP